MTKCIRKGTAHSAGVKRSADGSRYCPTAEQVGIVPSVPIIVVLRTSAPLILLRRSPLLLLPWLIVLLLLVVLSLPLLILVVGSSIEDFDTAVDAVGDVDGDVGLCFAIDLPYFSDCGIGSFGRFGRLCAFWCFFEVCSIADVRDPLMVAVLLVLSVLDDLGRVGGPLISDGIRL